MKSSTLLWLSFLLLALGIGLATGLAVGVFTGGREPGWLSVFYAVGGFGICCLLFSVTLGILALLASRQEQKPSGGDGRPQPGGRA